MPLENFAPDQWAQELTGPHYQEMMQAGWPAEVVEHSSNTLFNFLLMCGPLLIKNPYLKMSAIEGSDKQNMTQTNAIPLTEKMAVDVMDYFAETIACASTITLERGLPLDVRQHILSCLAQDVYDYCRDAVAYVQLAEQKPTRSDIKQWLGKTANEAFVYYFAKYEQEFGTVTPILIPRQPFSQSPQNSVTDAIPLATLKPNELKE
jgi:hypothetical protein